MNSQNKTSLRSILQRLATLAALGVGVVGSVATSEAFPMLTDSAASDEFVPTAEATEHRFKLKLSSKGAEQHTLSITAQSNDGDGAPIPLELEIIRVDREPEIVTGTAEAWPFVDLDIEPTCEDDVCTTEETLIVRTRSLAEVETSRLVFAAATVTLSYPSEVPAGDSVDVELVVDEAALDDAQDDAQDGAQDDAQDDEPTEEGSAP